VIEAPALARVLALSISIVVYFISVSLRRCIHAFIKGSITMRLVWLCEVHRVQRALRLDGLTCILRFLYYTIWILRRFDARRIVVEFIFPAGRPCCRLCSGRALPHRLGNEVRRSHHKPHPSDRRSEDFSLMPPGCGPLSKFRGDHGE
jgi:hypothetical protein